MAQGIAKSSPRNATRAPATSGVVITVTMALLLSAAFYFVAHAHLFLSTTESMRPGLYWLSPGERVERGDVAIACVPSAFAQWALSAGVLKVDPRCDGVEPVLKRVVAVEGDQVTLTQRGVFVNGHLEPDSQRRRVFRDRPIPAVNLGNVRLRAGETLLLGDHRSASFDGRYFGVTDRMLGPAFMILGF